MKWKVEYNAKLLERKMLGQNKYVRPRWVNVQITKG